MGMTDKQFSLQLRMILDVLREIKDELSQDRKEEAIAKIDRLANHLQVTIED